MSNNSSDTPPGTPPQPMRRRTKAKQIVRTAEFVARANERRVRKLARKARAA